MSRNMIARWLSGLVGVAMPRYRVLRECGSAEDRYSFARPDDG